MSSFNFEIQGAKELERALKQLGPKIEKSVAKSAVRAGANVIAKEARLRVPQESGTLKRSIRVVARSRRTGDAVASVVTRSGKRWNAKRMNAWYAPLVEFGTKLRPATPFLRPALDSRAAEAIKAMSDKIQQRIAKFGAG